jgi:hypothetical protein
MNQLFDAGRWWLLVGKHWSENRKKYTLSLIAIAGLLLLWFFVIIVTDNRSIVPELQLNTYYSGLFIVGCLYGSMLFADLGSKTRGLNYMVVPASHLEKLLCALFYSVVVFFACYTAIFYVTDFIMLKAANAIMYSHWIKSHSPGDVFVPGEIMNVFSSPDRHHSDQPGFVFYLLLFYFVLQAAFIYGSIFYAKFSLIKTVISLLLIGLCSAFILGKVIKDILPPGNYHEDLTSYTVYTVKKTGGDGIMIYSDANTDKLISLPGWIGKVLVFLLQYAFAPLFWIATYYRLKEKEI